MKPDTKRVSRRLPAIEDVHELGASAAIDIPIQQVQRELVAVRVVERQVDTEGRARVPAGRGPVGRNGRLLQSAEIRSGGRPNVRSVAYWSQIDRTQGYSRCR